jgi:xanthine dehydrogenase YagR molybdenum-binding subunit
MTRPSTLLGEPLDRVDGRLKVTGAAHYPSDFTFPRLAHAALVQSTIAAGSIKKIDRRLAETAAGVLAVVTHENAPALAEPPGPAFWLWSPLTLRDNRVRFHGQYLAIVVAETEDQARAAARLVAIEYDADPPVLGMTNSQAQIVRNPWKLEIQRGDVEAALASAPVACEETFTIAPETNNPMGLFATAACWDGDRLLVHDSTQWPRYVQQTLAAVFGMPEDHVRILAPYMGGGFGAGLGVWPHTVLTALAARVVARPVKLVLTRPQMFTGVGHRPESRQRMRMGADRNGRLLAIYHEGTSTLSTEGGNVEPITWGTQAAYACPNVTTRDRQVRLNIPPSGAMRGPGSATGNFAIESALDELSWKLGIDPIDLRLRNYTEVHPQSGLAWSSKALRQCYQAGAERFGWSKRKPQIGAMRDGEWLVGYGMAGVTYEWSAGKCGARITITSDGHVQVSSAGMDIGTGTYTIVAQLAAELLGVGVGQVHVELGDSDMPLAPQAGGSGLAISLAGAVQAAAANVLKALLSVVAEDERSPLRGTTTEKITASNGRIHLADDPSVGETFTDVLIRHELAEVTADAEASPKTEGATMAPSPAFAAHFAEVYIDRALGLIRVKRVVSVVDGGRILNRKLAHSQVIGAVIMGIGMTVLEETAYDPTGRIANATFGDYLIPANADIHDLDVIFVGEPDRFNALGVKGIGEIGTIGVAAAIANAVFHATGRRFRSLPIKIEQLL